MSFLVKLMFEKLIVRGHQHSFSTHEPKGQSAVYAVVTSIRFPCVYFKGGGHQLRLVALRLPMEWDLWCSIRETTNTKVLTLLIIDRFLPLKYYKSQ